MLHYTNEEIADFHLINGKVVGSVQIAQRIYRQENPRRCCPHHIIFMNIGRWLRETISFQITIPLHNRLQLNWILRNDVEVSACNPFHVQKV